MIIAIDFDGTCVTHSYPFLGEDIGAVPVLNEFVKNNHKLILYTMRSDSELNDAIDWFKMHDIPLFAVQKNPDQHTWTSSPKCYAQLYIDDAALGCPLVYDKHPRAYADWTQIHRMLKESAVL